MSPIARLNLRLEQVRELSALAEVGEIARRYFAMNAFDGVLTIIGVLVGSYTAGVTDARIVLTTGFSTALAMGISGRRPLKSASSCRVIARNCCIISLLAVALPAAPVELLNTTPNVASIPTRIATATSISTSVTPPARNVLLLLSIPITYS